MAIRVNKVIKEIKKKLIANFVGYIRFQSLHTSYRDFLYQQLPSPFPLPTPHVVDRPLESFWTGIEHVVSWSEAEGLESSSPCWKKEL